MFCVAHESRWLSCQIVLLVLAVGWRAALVPLGACGEARPPQGARLGVESALRSRQEVAAPVGDPGENVVPEAAADIERDGAAAPGVAEGEVDGTPDASEPAHALEAGAHEAAAVKASVARGQSTCGRLENGIELPARGIGFERAPGKRSEHAFGHALVVGALKRAAAAASSRVADQRIRFGDLSREGGGVVPGHLSHQHGLDVDVFWPLRHAGSRAPFPSLLIPLDAAGSGHDYGDLACPDDDIPVVLDAAALWAFLEPLLGAKEPAVARLLLAEHLRTLLLAEAARLPWLAPKAVERFREVTCQPLAPPHDDHVHIRFFCPMADIRNGCEDPAPIYTWRARHLEGVGLPQRASKRRRCGKTATVSMAQARRAAGEIHVDVERFLDRRRTWSRPPKTGRPYCP